MCTAIVFMEASFIIKSSHVILCDMYLCLTLKFCSTYCIKLRFLLFIRECLSTYGHTINDGSNTTILPFPWIQCSSNYYHGNDSNITMDEQTKLISLKYLRRYQLISQGITLPLVLTKETEFSMATLQYLKRHRLDDTSIVEQRKPYNSSNDIITINE